MDWSRLLNTGFSLFKRYRAYQASQSPADQPRARASQPQAKAPGASGGYLGDWTGQIPDVDYAPRRNNAPDPGEVVWAWVPFEEDHSQGKDRPVLILCEHPEAPDAYLALQLTSQDHDRDAEQERRAGRLWMDIGSGAWDRTGRPSEVRLNRVLALRANEVRREGASLDQGVFSRVVDSVREVSR